MAWRNGEKMKKIKYFVIALFLVLGSASFLKVNAQSSTQDETIVIAEEFIYDENGSLLNYTKEQIELEKILKSTSKTIKKSSSNIYGNGSIYSEFNVIEESYKMGSQTYNVISFDSNIDPNMELIRSTNCTLKYNSYLATGEAVSINGVTESTLVVKINGTLYPYPSTRSNLAAVQSYKIVHVYTVYPNGNVGFES